jgi:hypothetical protein
MTVKALLAASVTPGAANVLNVRMVLHPSVSNSTRNEDIRDLALGLHAAPSRALASARDLRVRVRRFVGYPRRNQTH